MHAAIDQRPREEARVPLDLWIRLAHEDYEDDFDADGVDLSVGGIALRSDYLPEVGDRLRCRFECPPTGEEIEVDGEVVWAHDAGERSGEFGLSFGQLDEKVQESLRQLVTHLNGDAAMVTRLHLDGVASPIEAQILERDARWLTVEQELPFLEIGMGVTIENGGGAPRGRLASVDLRIEDGTPRLVLSVELEPIDEDTFEEEEELVDASAVDIVDEPDEPDEDGTLEDFALPEELREAVEEAEPVERDEVEVFAIEPEAPPGDEREREAITPGDLMAAPDDRLGSFQAKLAPFVTAAKDKLLALGAEAKPALAGAWAKLVLFFGMVVEKGGPKAKAFFVRVRGFVSRIRRSSGKRRTTAAPRPKRVAGPPRRRKQRAEPEPEPAPRRSGRQILALSVLAFAGVGAAVYTLAGGEEEPEEVEVPAAASAPAPPPVEDPVPSLIAPATAPAAMPAAVETPVEGLAAAPPPEGGPLAEPSYPSLSDGSAGGPVSEGQSFGAASVADARSATIRMSQPVTTIHGTRQDDGFSVIIPGALALDRAGPIAAANPSVERAMILNRGDHSVLTVRFVAGRSPAYRVVARGRAIVIDIGR